MKLKANFLAFSFPFLRKLNYNSSIFKIIKAFFAAFFISNSIYFSFFENFWLEFISPFLAIYGLLLLLKSDKFGYFFTGFFISLLWFYWIAFSSVYYNLHFIIPFEILGIGLVYAIIFRLIFILPYDLLRLIALFFLPFLHIFGFDWLNWGVLVVYGPFECSWRGILGVFVIAYLLHERYISRYYKIALVLIALLATLQYKDAEFTELQKDYKLINTDINEATKFQKGEVKKNADFIVAQILHAIDEKKELIIFPESSFAFDLERGFGGAYFELLKDFSHQIQIVVGAPHFRDEKVFNSAYIFENGEVQILSKHYLVAFGEEMPKIPYVSDLVRKYLLPNMSDFTRGAPLNQYYIGEQLVTNAICYEVTTEALYRDSKIIVAISNNAWFDKFIEPALQKLLIKFYASKHGVSVYHTTNSKETAVIFPKKSPLLELKAKIFGENPSENPDFNKNLSENSSENLDFDENSSYKNAEILGVDENLSENLDENSSLNLDKNSSKILENDKNSSLKFKAKNPSKSTKNP